MLSAHGFYLPLPVQPKHSRPVHRTPPPAFWARSHSTRRSLTLLQTSLRKHHAARFLSEPYLLHHTPTTTTSSFVFSQIWFGWSLRRPLGSRFGGAEEQQPFLRRVCMCWSLLPHQSLNMREWIISSWRLQGFCTKAVTGQPQHDLSNHTVSRGTDLPVF